MKNTSSTQDTPHFDKTVLNALYEHIAVLDTSGHILFVNQAWKTFADANSFQDKNYGVGENYFSFMIDDELTNGIQSVLKNNVTHYGYEYPCHSPTENRWFWLYITPLINEQKEVIGAVTSHINITEHKLAEIKILKLQNQLLESERNRILIEIAGAVAHEINQPLTAVLGLSELLTKHKDLPKEVAEDIQLIFESSQKIYAITRKMQMAKTYASKPYIGDTHIADFTSKDTSAT